MLRDIASSTIESDTPPDKINEHGKRQKPDADGSPQSDVDVEIDQATVLLASVDLEEQTLQSEDLLRSHESRSTGYAGPNSDVQWLRHLTYYNMAYFNHFDHLEAPKQSVSEGQYQFSNFDHFSVVTDSTYYLDSQIIEVDGSVNAYELPPAEVAQKLFDLYMTTVNTSFPVLPKSFQDQFRQYYEAFQKGQPLRVRDNWRAVLNLVFAIGARYLHLVRLNCEIGKTMRVVNLGPRLYHRALPSVWDCFQVVSQVSENFLIYLEQHAAENFQFLTRY